MKNNQLLKRGVDKILPSTGKLKKLLEKRKIKVYLGIDPTGTKLHLGHSIALRKLQEFADAGHEATLLFGTGTVLAGDPSQRESARKKIAAEQIEHNISDWKGQVKSIIDFNKVNIMYNGEWLLKLGLKEIINIASNVSAIQLIKRDSFDKRIKKGDTVWTHEILYPLLQGYDSVAMDIDLEIGGTDQTFNMLMGRELQKKMNRKEKYVLTVPMILGTDGKQMSKTSNNCIWLNDSPEDMFGKILSIPDDQIESYMELLSTMTSEEVDENAKALKLKKVNPIEVKKELAFNIVSMYHGRDKAKKAQEGFKKTFQEKLPEFKESTTKHDLLYLFVSDFVGSRAEAKRLVKQGAVDINDKTTNDPSVKIKHGDKIKIGKKIFVEINKK